MTGWLDHVTHKVISEMTYKVLNGTLIPLYHTIPVHAIPICLYQMHVDSTLWFKKNAPTSADYNYDPVQSILIIFSKLFVNDHKSCLVVKFSTSLHICWNTMLYFALITLLIGKNAHSLVSQVHRPPDLWLPNSPDLNPVDYRIWGL